jgi:monoamine oxidase
MKRRDFLKACAALGATMPFFKMLGCASGSEGLYWDLDVQFEGKVIVVGAGAAGLAAGYLLDRYGIDFEILEAGPEIGGRLKRDDSLAEFPIDLGAEWIHEEPTVLAELVDDPQVEGEVELIPYTPQTMALGTGGELITVNAGQNYYTEHKFKRSTWFGFVESFIATGILDRVQTGRPIVRIEHGDEGVVLTDQDGAQIQADRVLLTVPIKVLQDELIAFSPELPSAKLEAIESVHIPYGLKVFLRFSERFYPDITLLNEFKGGAWAEKIYYDAAFGKDSPDHVLALFWVGDDAHRYTKLDDEAMVQTLLEELDALFDGQASAAFEEARVQNWSAQPWIRGAYSVTFSGNEWERIEALRESVDRRLYWAGEALSHDNGATVPGAMQSAYEAVRELLETA